jgi:YD repeat-containing protein
MRYKKITASFGLLFILCFSLKAQNGNYALRNVIPPSATVASLGKYGEIPVSLYTGIPNISIPLYEIKDGSLTVPISLSYHAAGIRVEEIASNVGLGWTLNAGGILGRQIRGNADESGWITDAPNRIANILQSGSQWDKNQMINDIEHGVKDGEPDIYYYNFNGQSGKFLFDQDGSLHNYPIKNVSVAPGVGGWKIIIEDGTVYEFNKSETVVTGACSGFSGGEETAWYLTKITSNDGKRQISFTYEDIIYSAYAFFGETRNFWLGGGASACSIPDYSLCDGASAYYTQRLKRIDFSGGYVKFNYNNIRQDVSGDDKSLDQIEIYTSGNTLIKKYDLVYSYFGGGSNPDANRLKLTSLTEKSATSQKPPYVFTYEESIQLPSRLSAATDHWGYFNGKNNSTRIPSFNYTSNGVVSTFNGADKSANPATMQAGILKKIQYPTGGETWFTYETNTAVDERLPATTYTDHHFFGLTESYEFLTSPYETGSFTIPSQGADASLFVDGLAVSASVCAYEVNLHCYLIKDNNVNEPFATITDGSRFLQLPAGSYKFRFTFDNLCYTGNLSFTIGLDAKIPVLEDLSKRIVGGLRIQKIEDKPGNGGQSVIRKYRYETEDDPNISSGKLINFPEYGYMLSVNSYGPPPECIPGPICSYFAWQSKTNYPLATTQGSYVGYSHVIEDLEDNGEIRHSYSVSSTSNSNSSFPFQPVETYEWTQGSEIATKYYAKKNGQLVLSKEINYDYYYSNPDFVYGYIAARAEIDLGPCHNPSTAPLTTYTRFPRFFALNHINERLYNQNDPSKYVETTTDYTYNSSHYQVAEIRTRTSSSDATVKDEIVVNKKYPQEYVFSGTPLGNEALGIKKLKDLHIVNVPIEEYTVRQKRNSSTNALSDQRVVGGTITTFKSDNPYPDQVYNLELTSPISLSSFGTGSGLSDNSFVKHTNPTIASAYKSKLQFISYDDYGNLTTQKKANNVEHTYLWGYGKNYPVAEIIGAPHSTASSYFTESVINSPSDDASLRTHLNNLYTIPNAQVKIFTYKPLIGMSSQTDENGRTAFYEYDSFGRLQVVKDKDGNVVKTFEYTYKQ